MAALLAITTSGCLPGRVVDAGPVLWRPVTLPAPAGIDQLNIRTVAGTGPTDIWVLGRGARRGVDGSATELMFHFDGSVWTPIESPGRAILSLVALAPDDVWTVGRYGTVAHWDGRAWTITKIDGVDVDLVDVAGTHNDLWAAEFGSDMVHLDGTGWIDVSPPELAGADISHVFALPTGEVFVARDAERQTPAMVEWRERTWQVQPLGPEPVGLITGTSRNDLWNIGYHNYSYHFDGQAWAKFPTASNLAVAAYATSPTEAYLVGVSGLILSWDGSSWTRSSAGTRSTVWTVYAPAGMRPLIGGDAGLFQHI